jgi:NAD(P)-dependent dehydrogenase (short-subunit alcohol dehydrogenase family)
MNGTQMKNGKLYGKIAVVTAASKGIGAKIAKEFASESASVVVNYASAKQDADRVVDEISKRGGKAIRSPYEHFRFPLEIKTTKG